MLPPATVRAYRDDRFAIVRQLFDPTTVADVAAAITRIARDYPATRQMVQFEPAYDAKAATPGADELTIRKLFRMARHDVFFRALASHAGMLAIARELLDDDVALMQSMLLMKPPRISGIKVWHQDNAYFRLSPPDVVGFWVAIDPATVDNGCMHVLPGSHRDGIASHEGEGDAYGLVAQPAFETARAIPLAPGDALLFHGELHHGTPANRTSTRRRALQYHYTTARAMSSADREAEIDEFP